MVKKAVFLIAFVMATAILGTAFFTTFKSQTSKTSGNTSNWSLRVDGLVQNPLNLTFGELKAMPRTTVNAKLFCVDSPNSPVAQGYWTGVKLSVLLEEANVSSDAVKIAFFAEDGYATDLYITTGMRGDVVIAYELNGNSLPEKVRLVVPGEWGYKWIGELNHIELVNFDFKGTWESAGYSDEANITTG